MTTNEITVKLNVDATEAIENLKKLIDSLGHANQLIRELQTIKSSITVSLSTGTKLNDLQEFIDGFIKEYS